ncbi:low-specificity L-threonine aldolase [Anaerorhabdus furcosa]|uniref:L-threonine aldolase n=1 Tax=Anaerorhabdus furcosa TaxID=118967 RepID=A0A1T4JX61_9FIRM|nr:low-specificity L-threonine aldolase [Anaerorhabdus furcosa]SJZ34615.1 L-threonine aldolase [Anaerorhabdus furcosa]
MRKEKNGMKSVDFRSDTVTFPTQEMRNAMMNAKVGDDVYGDDPTVIELENLAAKMLGKEAGLFVSSGTMGNLLSIWAHTNRGEEIITGWHNHIIVHEQAGIAQICQVMPHVICHENDFIYPEDIEKNIRPDDIHEPKTTLVSLENALSNGLVIPLDIMKANYEMAKKYGLKVHLDGARIFNAATSLKCDVKDIAQYTDSVTFCLSKGLAAPYGSVIVGNKEFIERARRHRKMIGGGTRQAGMMAACGLVALKKMTKRLKEDHANAKYIASELAKLDGICVDVEKVQINMVFFKFDKKKFNDKKFVELCKTNNLLINPSNDCEYRVVTHYWIEKKDCDLLIKTIKSCLKNKK